MSRDRRMVTTSNNAIQQLQSLPIPAGALVIDIRDVGDGVLEMLEGEIKNLANETNMQQVDHWRYLTSFIEFLSLSPLSLEEVKELRGDEDKQQKQQARSVTGRYQRPSHKVSPGSYYEDEDLEPSFMDQIPNDQFKRNIEDCVRLIDTIRNNRFKAVGDMHRRGNIGPHAPNPKVQAILLADEDKPSTLSSAAAYAVYLKSAYKGLEQSGQGVLDTTIICLNHDNQSSPPRLLINRLGWKRNTNQQDRSDNWEHIDALFLCERYGHNAVRIPQHVQPYLAELLLYTLLITPPMMVRPEPPEISGLFLPPPNTQESQQLPVNTYLVGLNAIEYSGRWGRHYLNYSLVAEIIRTLNDQQYDQQQTTRNVATTWLRRWRIIDVRKAIPDMVGGDIPALQAFKRSERTTAVTSDVFVSHTLVPHTDDKHIHNFGRYVDNVAKNYMLTHEEQEKLWEEQPSSLSESTISTSEQVSLEDALTCAPAIISQMQNWQPGDPEPPLIKAQQEAQRVLSRPDFFPKAQGAVRGAIPRAKQQLDELSKGILNLQNEHKRNSIDLKKQRQELIKQKDNTIIDLQEYQKRFPLLAGLLKLKYILAGLTLLLSYGLVVISLFLIFAWFHHLLKIIPNLDGFVNVLDAGSLLGLSLYTLIIWSVIVAALLTLLLSGKRIIQRILSWSAVRTETYFWIALIAYPILGLIVSLSAGLGQNDPSSYNYISWMKNLDVLNNILLSIAVTIALVEIIDYFIWHNALMRKLAEAVQGVKDHQKKTSDLVRNYLADTVALELLRRAELTDGNGGPGPYYRRIDQLLNSLDGAESYARDLHELASQRLIPRGNDGQSLPTEKKPSLEIRTEILDVPRLTASAKRIRSTIGDKTGELQEFAEVLLRVMSAEESGQLEQDLRDQLATPDQISLQSNREQQHAQILLSVTAALALRVELDPQVVTTVPPLKERYHELGYRVTNSFTGLQLLFTRLEDEAGREVPLAQSSRASTGATTGTDDESLTDYALLTWCQSLWEQKDPEICKLLEAKTITEYLQREGYDPQTVKGMLAARAVITGRAIDAGQVGELSFLMFPSRESNRFFEDMGLEPHFVGIPDMERLILLYIHQYLAPPHYIVKDDQLDDQMV